jgi:hypothetical protein
MTGINRARAKKKTHGMIVQPRDLAFLRILAMLGVVDRELFKVVAGFTSTTRANARLLQLYLVGLLRRFFLGSGGGRKALYALSLKGAKLAGVPYRGPRRRRGEVLVADFYIQHQLAVNEVYCTLRHRPISVPGVEFVKWLAFHESVAPSLRLIPDGYVELTAPSQGKVRAFIEVDLGHEGLSVWLEKARQYLQLGDSGEFKRRFEDGPFRVLVLATSDRRLQKIRKTVSAVTEKIFWFTTLESAHSNFFASVWLRPASDQHKSLFETNP